MITVKDKSRCTGCGACVAVCHTGALALRTDAEGFLYPVADPAKCVSCGRCDAVCPVLNAKQPPEPRLKASYGGYTTDSDVRSASSSGGIFYPLARRVLRCGGVVFGAAFDERFLARQVKGETEEEVARMRGSKYLESRPEDCYREAKEALDAGRYVLYSGTACKVAGLKAYLGRDYDRLLTVDLLCHGVPSPVVWRRYLDMREEEYGAPVSEARFRTKFAGWKNYSMRISFANGKEYTCKFDEDPYMKTFLAPITLRPSCHNCVMKAPGCAADITVGDLWGIENVCPDLDDDAGASVILVHTERGEKALSEIADELRLEPADPVALLRSNRDSRISPRPHPNRGKFYKRLEAGDGFAELLPLLELPLRSRAWRAAKRTARRVLPFLPRRK